MCVSVQNGVCVCSLRGLALPSQRGSVSPAHCADPVAPNFLELDLVDSLSCDVKEKSSWVLCWEQPVLDAFLSPLLPIPKLQIA